VIRQRLATKINVFHKKVMLGNWSLPIARQEDEWDAQVNMRAGRSVDGDDDDVRWVDAVRLSERQNQDAYERDQANEREITRKMQRIVDLETKLALEEGHTIVRGRKRRPITVINPER
jgi:hypothetical protein